mgnify:CR=1 FL=1
MSQAPSCRPPAILDVFCRDDENLGRQEAAVIFREVRTGGGWVGILVTGERFFELTAERYTMAEAGSLLLGEAWNDHKMSMSPG